MAAASVGNGWCHGRGRSIRARRCSSWLLQALSVAGQFAVGSGQFGGAGYDPPAPICPPFSCPAGQKAVGKEDHQIWSYGCKDSGMNILNAASFDPKNPYASMQQKSVDKCCVERDICKQTCGMTSKACHDNFQKCSKKICKGDQNCQLQSMMSELMSEPYDAEEGKADYKFDPEETKCRGYKRGQKEACHCVPKDMYKSATENKLKQFYLRFNPEKLDKQGEIKDVDDVWKKWKGKEPDMFLALATKYKAAAVEIREKPKPPPYKPPPDDTYRDAGTPNTEEDQGDHGRDPEHDAFEEKRAALEAKKARAKASEDYELADEAKQEAAALIEAELNRLQAKKQRAVEEEDYLEAKRVKLRLAKLAEL